MSRCTVVILVIVSIMVVSALPAAAQQTPAGAKMMVPIGAGGTTPRTVKGQVVFTAVARGSATPGSVVFYVQDKEIGRSTASPYRVEWDSRSVPDGQYIARSAAIGEAGEQVWTGEVKIIVANTSVPAPAKPAPAPKPTLPVPKPSTPKPAGVAAPSPPKPGPAQAPAAARPPSVVAPPPSKPQPAPPPGPRPKPGTPPGHAPAPVTPAADTAWETYQSKAYGFSVAHPASAKARDESASMKPKGKGAFWIAFTQKSGNKAEYAINVRHLNLMGSRTPDEYAKYNKYLLKWDRANVNGLAGFKTITGSPATKRVIHRTLLVDGSQVWMLNLTDLTGRDPAVTGKIFARVVESFKPSGAGMPPDAAPAAPPARAPAPPPAVDMGPADSPPPPAPEGGEE